MKLIDNVNEILQEDLKKELNKGTKISIVAASFSIYAFRELAKELGQVEELNFVFNQEMFTDKANPEEADLYGTEFETRLRNDLLQQKLAKECADWIREKVHFKSNVSGKEMPGFITADETSYSEIKKFTTVDLGMRKGNMTYYPIHKTNTSENGRYFVGLFDEIWDDEEKLQDVTDEVLRRITALYSENSPEFIYFLILYNIFSEFLEDVTEDELPNEATGFKESKIWNTLYQFQKDAAIALVNKLEKYNGCILADSVGLGKTFTALAVVKYYESRNKSVLVLCPKKLAENWNTYKSNYVNNPLAEDRLRYDVLFHTDLSRDHGLSNGIDLGRINWGNYDLVVIDESHNFRNGVGTHSNSVDNRYKRLMDNVIKAGVKTKVLMLSATPVNNRFYDLRNQLALAYEGDSEEFDERLDTKKTVDDVFKVAQKAFNAWNKKPQEERTTAALLKMLDFDFFEILDAVTIARSRKHIEKYYNAEEIGKFPERLKPISIRPSLTDLDNAINYKEIYEILMSLHLTLYTPSDYILPSRMDKYMARTHNKGKGLTQKGREQGIRRLMGINLMKRLESSVSSFALTVKRIWMTLDETIQKIEMFHGGTEEMELVEITDDEDFDFDDQNIDDFTVGKKVKIDLEDMDYLSWVAELKADRENLSLLMTMVRDINPEHDEKLNQLKALIKEKVENPINESNKKVLIFTAFADTADYLYENLSSYMKKEYGLETAEISGAVAGKTTLKGIHTDLNTVLTCFSPKSKGRDTLMPGRTDEIDVLIATDCISEGQNLQDCDYVVNYDIHWNPVRLVQRFGRVDRIGSKNQFIQLVNFWPDVDLDEYINLKGRVETRMKISVMTSTGDDNLIDEEEKGDLEYRKAQLKRLQEEVVDLEDMNTGISIMDLGLNEYRLDLLEYIKKHPELEHQPKGLYAVVPEDAEDPKGIIFVLKNINGDENADAQNRIHPFYMVYVDASGEIVCDYMNPKKLLDTVKLICKGRSKPDLVLCEAFNKETDYGRDMSEIKQLLSDAIDSILDVKEESDIDSLFTAGGTSALMSEVDGLDDFELICYLAVR